MWKSFQWVNLFCSNEAGVNTDFLREELYRAESATSFDWRKLLVFWTSEVLARFAETDSGAKISVNGVVCYLVEENFVVKN